MKKDPNFMLFIIRRDNRDDGNIQPNQNYLNIYVYIYLYILFLIYIYTHVHLCVCLT